MNKLLYVLILLLTSPFCSYSQDFDLTYNKFLASWEIAVPTSGYLKKATAAGFRGEYRRMVSHYVSIGLAISWNSFRQYDGRQSYTSPDGNFAITTDIYKDVYTVPFTAEVHYYFCDPDQNIHPYVGLGLGAEYSDQRTYFNVYKSRDENWGFVFRPELGAIYNFNWRAGIFVSAAYNFSTNKNDFFDIKNLQHFSFNLGFLFSVP